MQMGRLTISQQEQTATPPCCSSFPKLVGHRATTTYLPTKVDNGFSIGSYACSREVSQLQTLSEKDSFKRANVQIVGVSADSVEKQKAFVVKQKLTVGFV